MNNLRTTLLNFSFFHRVAIAAILTLAASALFYQLILAPQRAKLKAAKAEYETLARANRIAEKQIENLSSSSSRQFTLTESQGAALDEMGNSIFTRDEVPEFLNLMKELTEKAGGKEISIQEGEPAPMLVQPRDGTGYFVSNRLPLMLRFKGDYAEVSELLFQLRGMRRFLQLPLVKMKADDYTPELEVEIKVDLNMARE